MTTYAEFKAGKTNIVPIQNETETLVLGWLDIVYNINNGEYLEVRYALHPDGLIKQTHAMPPNSYFNIKNRAWFVTPKIPDDAKFIGNYKADMF